MVSTRSLGQALLLVVSFAATSLAFVMPKHQPRVAVSQDHYEVLRMRASAAVNPAAVLDTECVDSKKNIVFHDQNVAELAICGGIAGSIQKCGGAPASTVGQSGTAMFTLDAVQDGATINISKGRWEQCVRAARAVCPTGSLKATCVGGASAGEVAFTLDNP